MAEDPRLDLASSPAWTLEEEAKIEPALDSPIPDSTPEPPALESGLSQSAANTADLDSLSEKLPLNRYQAIGLLIALAILGTITYIGLSSNGNNPTPGSPPPESSTTN
ncbi:MAG: hypothetical protein HC792_06690 [Acaryochloridaceae cyanobacterium CSU_5_19]|nr:hypothetical protein [Acaryochloridaceae cyanobacterium CSU_5_19]